MSDFKNTYEKAGLLMSSALKKYQKGDIEGGDNDRKEANRLYDMAEREVSSAHGAAMLYGESTNFGTIYKVFESNTSNLIKKENAGKLKKILKLIKENKVLKSEFDVYKTLVYPESVNDAEGYVNEALSIIPEFNEKKVRENNQKLINLMNECKLNTHIDINPDESELYEAVEYVMLNKKTLNNINDYVEAKNCITEHVEKNCHYGELKESTSVDEIFNEGLDKLNENFKVNLNDTEKVLVEKLSKEENKEAYFESAKLDTIKLLNEQLNECEGEAKEKLSNIIENITKKSYNEDKFLYDAAELREIKDTLLKESVNTEDLEKVKSLVVELTENLNGKETRNAEWIKGEISYLTPDNVNPSMIFEDISKLSDKFNTEDVSFTVINNLKTGKYNF